LEELGAILMFVLIAGAIGAGVAVLVPVGIIVAIVWGIHYLIKDARAHRARVFAQAPLLVAPRKDPIEAFRALIRPSKLPKGLDEAIRSEAERYYNLQLEYGSTDAVREAETVNRIIAYLEEQLDGISGHLRVAVDHHLTPQHIHAVETIIRSSNSFQARRDFRVSHFNAETYEQDIKEMIAAGCSPTRITTMSLSAFTEVFSSFVPFSIPDRLRPQHVLVVGSTGAGKSQLLESLILDDLEKDDPPAVVLIDSKAGKIDPLQRVSRLDVFHPDHGRLKDRLIILDPRDKPSINLFDEDSSNIRDVVASMRYFMGGLFGNQLSGQMDVLLIPLLHIMLRIKGATLQTFRDVIRNPLQYRSIIDQLPEGPKDFLLKEYDNPKNAYGVTKTALITRLQQIINEGDLAAMFSAPRNAINLAKAMNEGKILLVSTEAGFLHDASAVFGRYIISRIIAAALTRTGDKRKRVHVYIDECEPYVDEKIEKLLTTMRSYGLGATLAFQNEEQMRAFAPTIKANTASKLLFRSHDNPAGPTYADFDGTFGDPAFVNVRLYFGALDKEPMMSEADYRRLREKNRALVCDAPHASLPVPASDDSARYDEDVPTDPV
jgi:hypothetical protein